MDRLNNIVRRIGGGGALVASIFLLAIMTLIVSNIIYRFFGGAFVFMYELVKLFAGMTAALAMAYTALAKRHIIINILLSRFSSRTQEILGAYNSVIGLGFWAVLTWGSIGILLSRGITEVTINYYIPLFPFRSLWIFALVLFCLILFMDIVNTLYRLVKK